jgi:hypothetical protein
MLKDFIERYTSREFVAALGVILVALEALRDANILPPESKPYALLLAGIAGLGLILGRSWVKVAEVKADALAKAAEASKPSGPQ